MADLWPEPEMSTGDLVRRALDEARLLIRAEVAHARLELKGELRRAMRAGIALGVAAALALCGLSLLFVAVAEALPLAGWGAALLVGGVLLALAAVAGAFGVKWLPKDPMAQSRSRLLDDVALTRERLA